MIKMQILLLATGIVRDTETNNISIFNIIEQLNAERFPVMMPELNVFALFAMEHGEAREVPVRVRANYRGGKTIGSSEAILDFRRGRRARLVLNLRNTVFEGPGMVDFLVQTKDEADGWIDKGTYSVEIVDKSTQQMDLRVDQT